MHKTRNLFRAKTAQKEFRVSVFALFLCASCYRIFVLQQPLLYYSISVVRHASIFRWKKARDTEELRRKAVAALITHGFCHLCNAQIRGNQQMLCVVDALADDVFRYAAPNRFLESSFQLRGAHESNFGKLFQRYAVDILVDDIVQPAPEWLSMYRTAAFKFASSAGVMRRERLARVLRRASSSASATASSTFPS